MADWYRGDCRFLRRESVSYGPLEMEHEGELEQVAADGYEGAGKEAGRGANR